GAVGRRVDVDDLVSRRAALEASRSLARPLDEDLLARPHQRLEVRAGLGLGELEEAGQARALVRLRDVVGELLRRGEGTRRILEAEEPDEADLADQLERGLEVGLRLPGEADD